MLFLRDAAASIEGRFRKSQRALHCNVTKDCVSSYLSKVNKFEGGIRIHVHLGPSRRAWTNLLPTRENQSSIDKNILKKRALK